MDCARLHSGAWLRQAAAATRRALTQCAPLRQRAGCVDAHRDWQPRPKRGQEPCPLLLRNNALRAVVCLKGSIAIRKRQSSVVSSRRSRARVMRAARCIMGPSTSAFRAATPTTAPASFLRHARESMPVVTDCGRSATPRPGQGVPILVLHNRAVLLQRTDFIRTLARAWVVGVLGHSVPLDSSATRSIRTSLRDSPTWRACAGTH